VSGRVNNRWTKERLEQCRNLYESGASNQVLGEMFGIKPASIGVMAWQHRWRRSGGRKSAAPALASSKRARQPEPPDGDPLNPSIPPTRMETAFNTRLCGLIRNYWRAQGKSVELNVQTMGCGIQCIRSRSINGVPTE
jgi:hypothetical protein